MSCIKKWALAEPLVDYVDRKSINSEACPIFVSFLLIFIYLKIFHRM